MKINETKEIADVNASFHKIIQKMVPELISLIDEIKNTPIDAAQFNSKVLPSWYEYYQQPFSKQLLESLTATNMVEDVQKIYSSDNPFEELINIVSPPIPFIGKPLPKKISGKQTAAILSLVKNFESILYNKKPINRLLLDIATGKDQDGSLIKQVLEIDRTAIHTEIIKTKLQDAEITHNKKLLTNVANALYPTKTKKPKVKYPQLTFAIFILLDFKVFDLMSEQEREQFLLQYYEEYKELNSFHRECNRIRNSLTTQKAPKRVGEINRK
ncbi:hypothetical protein [Thiomicrorhabdus sp. Milos-T2]|uniref:hypothetical protein n=1 Tax=Thiomicrorhabdus sp. Milos-T2 TaxID=90814 RepID=UPI000494797F|nr:hypothetical protein [Thiomicrorhabdus sp. Milos-T2]